MASFYREPSLMRVKFPLESANDIVQNSRGVSWNDKLLMSHLLANSTTTPASETVSMSKFLPALVGAGLGYGAAALVAPVFGLSDSAKRVLGIGSAALGAVLNSSPLFGKVSSMKTAQDSEAAFKLGFMTFLAQKGLDPSSLQGYFKSAGALDVATSVMGATAATSAFGSSHLGELLGEAYAGDSRSASLLRRLYLLERYRKLKREQDVKKDNRLLSEVLKEVPSS